jgi:hypothetical protein
MMRLGNKRGVYASLTIQGISDRFRLERPTILIAGANKGVGHVWGTCERIAGGGSVMWQIERGGSSKERAVPTWTRFLDGNVPGYGWSEGRRECSSNEEKGNGLCDRIAVCGAGGNGGREEVRMWTRRGSQIPSVARGPHTAYCAKAALINNSSSPSTMPT